MTVSAQTPRSGPYSGNGSTTTFGYGFLVEAGTEIVVTVADAAGAETVKTLTTDYTVSGVGNSAGGDVTFVTAPISTEKVVVTRTIAMTQAIDLQNRKSVVPTVLETAYDKLTRIVQDQNEQLGRSVKVDLFGTTDVAALTVNLNIVAAISSDVTAVSAISTDVTAVAGNIAAVQGADAAATAAGNSETAAALSLAAFERIYLGVKSSPPTVDNAGNALITGAQYFDSVTNKPFIWTTADAWSPAVFDAAGAALNSENLSGLASFSAARSNLELGTAAQSATGDFATAAQGTKADDAAPLDAPDLTGVPLAQTAAAGTDTRQLATTAFAKAAAASSAVGVAQTWQDMSASRASNLTVYQNTTGKPIQVNIMYAGDFNSAYFEVSVDNSTWVRIYTDSGDGAPVPMTGVIIPDDHYYRSDTSGGTNDPDWFELR